MVNPEVGSEVVAESVEEAEVVDRSTNGDDPEDNADVRKKDLEEVVRGENDRLGVEVWEPSINIYNRTATESALTISSSGVALLARRVGDEVHGPTNEQVAEKAESSRDRTVANGLPELLHDFLRDRRAF